MSCCRTVFVSLSLFLSVFFFIYGVFLFVKSKEYQDSLQTDTSSQQQQEQDQSDEIHQISAYMPDAKSFKFHHQIKDSSSYSYKVTPEFLKPYEVNETTSHDCNASYPPPRGKKCFFDFGLCDDVVKNESLIGAQETSSLCMFVKVKNDFKFIPRYYNSLNFPPEMPKKLKDVVKKTPRRNRIIWLSCEAEYVHNKQKIDDIRYFPQQGFSGYFFPCRPKYRCVDPIVGVLINNPQGQKNSSINIECRTWAENVWEKLEYTIFLI